MKKIFVDTNLLCYLFDSSETEKQATAKESGCSVLYSEDLNAGQTVDGVKIVNPFAI